MNKESKKNVILHHFKSIRLTILFSFSALIVFSLLIFLLISLNYTEDTVLDNSIDNTTQLIKQVNGDIDSYINYMENISSLVTNNENVKDYLFYDNLTKDQKSLYATAILDQFNTIMEARQDICNIAVISSNGRYIINDGTDMLNEFVSLFSLDWYRYAFLYPDKTALSSSHVQNVIKNNYKWVITLSKSIKNPISNKTSGIFFIDLNYNVISDMCENNSLGEKGYVFILDRDGNIIYHPQQQLLYSGLKTERVDQVLNSKTNYFVTDEGDESKLYTISTSKKTGWTIVGVVYESELMKNKTQTQIIYIVVAFILLAAAMIISVFISTRITRPIKKLKDSMKEVEKGHFDNANIEVISENEIGSLSKSFNIMTAEIKKLMEENIYEQKQKRKSELKALQSQINPHFLYNTLDSIIWMAESNKNKEVVLMTASLAKLLRQSISNENEVLTIEQEVGYITSYLTIQKMRYKDKLEYEIDVDKDICQYEIVKLVLQPIVENAIYHGIKFKETMCLLTIRGYSAGNNIIIKVIDNGVGMTEEVLAHIFDEHKHNFKSNGVGVFNVQMRLQLYYGKNYGITYESSPGEGTTATITIPKRRVQGDNGEKV
ncbi:sensor histidine kinase [Anaerocolumna sp. MB42-C2]|uniref:sensor histidine kinase n=1 Tax=Anaerocolumna sp. MB42-C2 TaxID=3070997 RepID=UPI0027E016D2|nr:sensor histidine kinase [Anaerocolumna sp. MB42-C2]WMJ89998.1 sensor histidine kinase [Anaerocolumna sp. MB42-C2]